MSHRDPYILNQLSESIYVIVEDDKYGENPFIYVITCEDLVVLIDTGCGSGDLLAFLKSAFKLKPDGPRSLLVINTHNHFDHVGANYQFSSSEDGLSELCQDLCMGDRDIEYSKDAFNSLGGFVGCKVKPYTVTRWLSDGERILLSSSPNCDGTDDYLQVIHSPGHTPDSICLWYPKENRLFMGDFIYRWANIMAIGYKSNTVEYEESAKRLVDFVDDIHKLHREKKGSTGASILMCCGHVDNSLEERYLLDFVHLLKRVNSASCIRGGLWWRVFETQDHSLSFAFRRGMSLDGLLKPALKPFC